MDVLKLGEVVDKTMNQPTSILDPDELTNLGRALHAMLATKITQYDGIQICSPDRSSDTKAVNVELIRCLHSEVHVLTNCFASAFRMISLGTPLNWRRGVMDPHLQVL